MNRWQTGHSYKSLYCQISGRVEFSHTARWSRGKATTALRFTGVSRVLSSVFPHVLSCSLTSESKQEAIRWLTALFRARERVNSTAVERQQDLFVLVSHNIWWRDWKTAEHLNSGLFTWWVTLRESLKLALIPKVKCEIHRAEYSSTAASLTRPDSVMLIWIHWSLFETKAFVPLWSYIICQSICPD